MENMAQTRIPPCTFSSKTCMPHMESWKTTPYNVHEVDATVPCCSMVKVYKNWRLGTLEIPWSHLNPFADQIISPLSFTTKNPRQTASSRCRTSAPLLLTFPRTRSTIQIMISYTKPRLYDPAKDDVIRKYTTAKGCTCRHKEDEPASSLKKSCQKGAARSCRPPHRSWVRVR